jgi:hypothetical protein
MKMHCDMKVLKIFSIFFISILLLGAKNMNLSEKSI